MDCGRPVLQGWFNLGLRRNRLSFVLASLVVQLGAVSLVFLAEQLPLRFIQPWWLVLPAIALLLNLQAQRCRDMNWSGWWTFLSIVPLANIIFYALLVFRPGTPGPNRFGAS